jgi:putative Mg2+ transporter-C (MgtC) family protein
VDPLPQGEGSRRRSARYLRHALAGPSDYLPILGALIAGGLIGFEREYRSRPAGLRTHVLVALASALLMLAAVHQVKWMSDTPLDVMRIDPVRMAHGVLTGVGFLCGGVIFQQGASVHGLTTAASLWITSAIGTLFGVGLYDLAIGGAILTVAVLSAARLLDKHLPQKNFVEIAVRSRRETLVDEGEFRASLGGCDLKGARLINDCSTAARWSSWPDRSPARACCA